MAGFLTPKGRYVQGNPFLPETTDYEGKPLVYDDGTPYSEFYITVAFPKGDSEAEAFIQRLGADCVGYWPTQFPRGISGPPPQFGAIHPRFSSKVIDGDGKDGKGQPNAGKDGFAGHWLVRMATKYPIKVFEAGKYDPMQDIVLDPGKHSLLKRGYFIRVSGSTDTNASDQTPGIKVYPNMIEIVHAGPEIVTGPDAASVFGGGGAIAGGYSGSNIVPPPAIPTGGIVANPGVDLAAYRANGWTDDLLVQHGHATRAAPLPVTPPPVPAAPIPPALPPVPTAAMPSPSNAAPPPPYAGYMAPPVVPARVMLPAAGGATYEQLTAAGWTDAQLVQHGMMSPN